MAAKGKGGKGTPVAVDATARATALKGTLSIMTPPTTTVNTSSAPRGMYIPPDGKNLYAGGTNYAVTGPTQIFQFDRDVNNGKLTPMSPISIDGVYGPGYITGDSGGLNVYTANGGGDYVATYVRNQTTGALSAGATQYLATGVYPNGIVVSPDDKFVYVSIRAPSANAGISIYSRTLVGSGSTTGQLTFVSTYNTGAIDGCMGICISPNGNHLYVACTNTNKILQFSRDTSTGALTPLSPAFIAAGSFASALMISKEVDGKHVYVANDGSATIGGYTRNDTTGLLTAMSTPTFPGGNGPWSLQLSLDGLSLYTAASDGQTIPQYTRSLTTGLVTAKVPLHVRSDPTITAVSGSGGPQNILVSPDGKNLYATNTTPTSSISQFHIHT